MLCPQSMSVERFFDRSDPEHPMVILNDSGHVNGQGAMVPLDEFVDAWDDSNNLAVICG